MMAVQIQCRLPFGRSSVWFLLVLLWSPNFSAAQDDEIVRIASPEDTNLCRREGWLKDMCLACAALPPMISLPVEQCCSEEDAMIVCSACLTDPDSCLLDVLTLENAVSAAVGSEKDEADRFDLSDNNDDSDAENKDYRPESDEASAPNNAVVPLENAKRYGTLYLGKRPLHMPPPRTVLADVIKRGVMGDVNGPFDDADADASDMEKRWGTLGLGSGGYGRYARLYWTPPSRITALARNNGKRWGSLGIGKRWGSLGIGSGKSWSSLGIGKRWGTLGIGKRWGSLGIGNWKRWGSLGLSSRYGPGKGKRWGTLSLGKRADTDAPSERDQLDSVLDAVEKRWGSLGLGKGNRWGSSVRGKRWGSLGLSSWRKRWGHLGLSRGKHWGTLGLSTGKRWGTLGIGKRDEILTALDDNASYLDSLAEADDEEDGKRWGTLQSTVQRGDAFGAGHDDEEPVPGISEDKRWGTLGLGKRWGNLGGFGGFKRWGYIGLGGRNSFLRPRKLAKRSVLDEGEPTQKRRIESREDNGGESSAVADARVKKWGSLGIGTKWGSLGLAKKWGTLGLGKKWGSLGIGKKWGSLSIGKKPHSSQSKTKGVEKNGTETKRWGSLGLPGKRDSSSDETAAGQ